MNESYESILEAARRLTAGERRELALNLLDELPGRRLARRQGRGIKRSGEHATAEGGRARRLFGAWDSGDERSADNDRIDRDLAGEYDNSSTRA